MSDENFLSKARLHESSNAKLVHDTGFSYSYYKSVCVIIRLQVLRIVPVDRRVRVHSQLWYELSMYDSSTNCSHLQTVTGLSPKCEMYPLQIHTQWQEAFEWVRPESISPRTSEKVRHKESTTGFSETWRHKYWPKDEGNGHRGQDRENEIG